MTTRTKRETVIFNRPFNLGGRDEVLPEGAYIIETEEELLQSLSFPAYRRNLTLMHLHVDPARPGRRQALPIDPDELEAALRRDLAAVVEPVGANVEERRRS